jgi:hypothetical protein
MFQCEALKEERRAVAARAGTHGVAKSASKRRKARSRSERRDARHRPPRAAPERGTPCRGLGAVNVLRKQSVRFVT